MNPRRIRPFLFILSLIVIAAVITLPHARSAAGGPPSPQRLGKRDAGSPFVGAGGGEQRYPNTDVRLVRRSAHAVTSGPRDSALTRQVQARSLLINRGITRLKEAAPGAEVTVSPLTGGVEVVSGAGALSGAAPGRTSCAASYRRTGRSTG